MLNFERITKYQAEIYQNMGEKENFGEEFREYNKKESLKRNIYIYFAVYLKLIQHCQSTVLQ